MKSNLFALGAALSLVVGCGTQESVAPRTSDDQRPQRMVQSPSPSHQMHELMMRPMQNMAMSGNVDKDFATTMAEHHQQAIDMAAIQVRHGKDEHLRRMAEKMIGTQTAERERLLQIGDQAKIAGANQTASGEMHGVMMRPMQNMRMSNDTDRDFASMMAEHHQGAIDMARIYLQHGQHAELRAMAQQMIDDQQSEKDMLLQHAQGR